MAALTAVEAAEAVDDDIYRSIVCVNFVVAVPSDERTFVQYRKDTLRRPRHHHWLLALVGTSEI